LRQLWFHHAPHDKVIVYSKTDGDDTVIVVCSLDPDHAVETELQLDFGALGVPEAESIRVRDELTGAVFSWGRSSFVRLTPQNPAHVLHVLDRG
jgi:starch synthase (maltosyl-transferring)